MQKSVMEWSRPWTTHQWWADTSHKVFVFSHLHHLVLTLTSLFYCERWEGTVEIEGVGCLLTLESPLDCKEIKPVNAKGSQSWIFIGRTDAKAEAQYHGPLMWRADSLEKTLMLGKIEGKRRRGWQRLRWLDGIIDSMDMNLSKLWEIVDRGAWSPVAMGSQRVRHDLVTEEQIENLWTNKDLVFSQVHTSEETVHRGYRRNRRFGIQMK